MDSHRSSSFSEIIRDWLETERVRYLHAARVIGQPLSFKVKRVRAVYHDQGEVLYDYDFCDVSILNDPVQSYEIFEAAGPSVATPARDLVDQYHDNCAYGGQQEEFIRDPETWVERHLLQPILYQYVRGLATLEQDDKQLAEILAGDLVMHIERDIHDLVTCIPLAGFEFADEKIESGEVSLRRLDAIELGQLAGYMFEMRHTSERMFFNWFHVSSERVALEIRESFNKKNKPEASMLPKKLLLALQLLGYEPHGKGIGRSWTEPRPTLIDWGPYFDLPQNGSTEEIDKEKLAEALKIAKLIKDTVIVEPKKYQDTALHRFSVGASRRTNADKLVDFVIALESVLLSGIKSGELSFRFRLNGAFYLSSRAQERLDIYNRLKKLYELRSALVHGAKVPSYQELAKGSTDARNLAAKALLKVLSDGWPNQEFFLGLVLKDDFHA